MADMNYVDVGVVSLRSNTLTADDFIVKTTSISSFLSTDSEWELIFSRHTGSDSRKLREHLLNILTYRDVPEKKKQWYFHRWSRCLFDSISPRYFLMTEIFVPVGVPSAKMTPFLKVEYDAKNELGHHDVTYLDLYKMTWGLTGNTQLMREKLNGVHIDRVNISGKYYWSLLGFVFKTGEFPTEILEWTSDGVYGLYPYGIPTHKVNGVEVVDHVWHAPNMALINNIEEGVMLLQGEREVRMKRIPSIELQLGDEVWECGMDDQGPVRIRPRYGKEPGVKEHLTYLPTIVDLEVPVVQYSVSYVLSGPYSGRRFFSETIYTIDSGYRMYDGKPRHIDHGLPVADVHDVLHVERIYYYMVGGRSSNGPTVSNKPCQSGVKAFVFDELNRFYLIKDDKKPFDLVGGSVSFAESTQDCLIREIFEETGSRVLPEDLAYLGVSTGHDDPKCDWHTYVYMIPSIRLDMTKFKLFTEVNDVQMWVPRIIRYVDNTIGSAFIEYYLSHTKVSVDHPTQRQGRMIKGVLGTALAGKKFFTGPDLIQAVYRAVMIEEIDFKVFRAMLGTDLRATPYINPLCDHVDSDCECSYTILFQGERRPVRAKALLDDVVQLITYITQHYYIDNGVIKRSDVPSVGSSIAHWVKVGERAFNMTATPGPGKCCICLKQNPRSYWFVASRVKERKRDHILCPRCYVAGDVKGGGKKKD